MNKNFKKMIKVIHSQSENELPTIKFSNSLKKYSKKARDTIEHFEAMLTLLEAHPFLPVNESFSLGSQSLNDRKTLAYEVIIRQIGHSRSLIANANIFNHIGMSVALRCMIELYAFVKFLHDKKDEMDESEWNILLNGSTNSRGEFYEYEIFWEKEFGKPPPRSFNKFF
ncbi:MAG: hypothetical protein KAR45_20625, partial [Desulfobacteraceae bacterium]|nr:hypothetical protein [Desulfobacteraceae bacterium]